VGQAPGHQSHSRFNLNVRTKTVVLANHRASKTVSIKDLQTGLETQEPR